ncbi:hypothetical protein PCAR4_710001 [Paraburkholderia caribensis]|nr:hypothetical protein PCAR4_710001 [Paraburkholderia caribensis]
MCSPVHAFFLPSGAAGPFVVVDFVCLLIGFGVLAREAVVLRGLPLR